jgi:hypothetical protein
MSGRTIWRALPSPWMILLFVAVGWGPVFLAELVRRARPDLDASYAPQAFAMGWLMVCLWCSVLAVAFAIGHTVRLIVTGARRFAQRRGSGAGGPT